MKKIMSNQSLKEKVNQDSDASLVKHSNALAEERTRLARERTILAHTRTGFSSFLFGVALLGLFSGLPRLFGYPFLAVGGGFIVSGSLSYLRSSHRTAEILARAEHQFRFHNR